MRVELPAERERPRPTFQVLLGAQAYLALKRDQKSGLGLCFDQEVPEDQPPVVTKVLATGFVPALDSRRKVRSGQRLVAVQGRPEHLLPRLRGGLRRLREALERRQAWQVEADARPKPLTEEMRRIRAYVTGEALAPGERARDAEPLPPAPEPEDYILALTFEEGPPEAPTVPPVPSVFTGENRVGRLWVGQELCEKYGSDAKHFTRACSGDARLGAKLLAKLHSEMERHARARGSAQ